MAKKGRAAKTASKDKTKGRLAAEEVIARYKSAVGDRMYDPVARVQWHDLSAADDLPALRLTHRWNDDHVTLVVPLYDADGTFCGYQLRKVTVQSARQFAEQVLQVLAARNAPDPLQA